MTALLASVKSLPEARRAQAAGADVVDCKDPARGALGALAPNLIRAVAHELGGRVCVSAAAGELKADPRALFATVLPIASGKIDFVKVGLPQDTDPRAQAQPAFEAQNLRRV